MRFFLIILILCINIRGLAQNGNNDPVLITAVKNGNIISVKELIDRGTDINLPDSNGATALFWAAGLGHTELVKYLVKKGAATNSTGVIFNNAERTSYYGNLTGIAAGEGHIEILQYLIDSCKIPADDKEFDPLTKRKEGWTALQWAAAAGKNETLDYLINKGADINASHGSDKGTPLIYALQGGHTQAAEILINKNADVNKAGIYRITPLMLAAEKNNIALCFLLWKKGADLLAKNENGHTALEIATKNNFYRIIDFLKTPENYEAIIKREYWSELNDSINYYSNKRDYEKAVVVGQRALTAAGNEFGFKHQNYGLALKSLSVVCRQARYFKLSVQKAEEAAALFREISGKNSIAYAAMLNQAGLSYQKLKDTAAAIRNFKQALSILRIPGNRDNLLESLLYNLASYYIDHEQAATAIPLIEEMLKMQVEIYGPESADYLDGLTMMANAFKESGKINDAISMRKTKSLLCRKLYGEKAVEYAAELNQIAMLYENLNDTVNTTANYKQAINILREQDPAQQILVNVINNFVDFLETENRLEEALLYSRENFRYIEQISGALSENLAKNCNQQARLYEKMSKYAMAEPLYTQAMQIRKKILGDQHSDYAQSLNNLAVLYSRTGKYETAETFYLEAKEIWKKSSVEINRDYFICLNNLGSLYKDMGQYNKAEPYYLESLELRKKMLGESSPEYATGLNNLALLYDNMGLYNKAETFLLQSREIRRKKLGEKHPDYAMSLNNLGSLYSNMGEYKKAESYFIESLELVRKLFGASHFDYSNCLNNLAVLSSDMGEYKKALAFLQESLEIRKNLLGEKHPDYAISLNNLANVYVKLGVYDKAERLYQEAGEIWKTKLGENHPNYSINLSALAILYRETGRFDKAEELFLKVNEIRKKALGGNHPDFATGLNNLGVLYSAVGKYEKAEVLYLRAKEIRRVSLGETNPAYATSLNNLALLYENMGQYDKAEQLFLQAMEMRKKTLGEKHPDYAMSLNNLAVLYRETGLYNKAEQLYRQSNEIIKNVKGNDDLDYALGINNLGALYQSTGDYDKAEKNYLEAIDIRKRILGEEHPDYALTLNNLAFLYTGTGKYEKAEHLYKSAISVFKKVYGPMNTDYALGVNNLALLYMRKGENAKAGKYLLEFNQIEVKNMLSVFNNLSENEKGKYLENKVVINDECNSFLYHLKKANPVFAKLNYDLQLLLKSLSLTSTKTTIEAVRNSSDSSVHRLFETWKTNKAVLARQYSIPLSQRREDLKKVEEQTEGLEKELTRKSADFKNQIQSIDIKTTNVQSKLEEGEVALEFVRFEVLNREWTDSIMYAAYILGRNDSIPVFVPLFEEKQLGKLFDSAGTSADKMVSSFYRGGEIKNKSSATTLGKDLYKLVWSPLEPYLKGVKKISYSPAGKLYNIAFHALPVDSNTVLMDKYELQQYTSTRQIVLRSTEEQTRTIHSINLFGDPAFTIDSISLAKSSKGKENVSGVYTPPNRGTRGGSWAELPGTADEIKKIKTLFDQHQNNGQTEKVYSKVYTRLAATEEALKSLNGNSSQVLHLATHGFFLPKAVGKTRDNSTNSGNTYSLAEDPLLRSGLILTGGNYAWSGKTPIEGVEDGIVTAYEISQLDLSNTELVVLSACETALGDVKGSEGVFGLQRAFKMAGVKKMIVSLWQVPDKETAELMTTFYGYLLQGKTITEAFAKAQAEMRKKYSAYYWAAFVLVE